ncbi:DNA replication complex GINS family protein [Candidatus Bathyarchaeota archaeon]|nr:DNA replication complex GINS family protein [Candidatus Bathyarchaeota archaeon]
MEYKELYEAWRRELSSDRLQVLPKRFYLELAQYVRRILNSMRMLDEGTEKAKLLKRERRNVQEMIKELLNSRFNKLLEEIFYGKPIDEEALTQEERKLYSKIDSLKEVVDKFIKDLLEGRCEIEEKLKERKYILIRFIKDVPAIVGSDMKTYGPFKPEDLATLPVDNAKILIKQGAAVEVETR